MDSAEMCAFELELLTYGSKRPILIYIKRIRKIQSHIQFTYWSINDSYDSDWRIRRVEKLTYVTVLWKDLGHDGL